MTTPRPYIVRISGILNVNRWWFVIVIYEEMKDKKYSLNIHFFHILFNVEETQCELKNLMKQPKS